MLGIALGSREHARQPVTPHGRRHGVEGVIDRHDPDQPALVVHHGHGQQVVMGDRLGDRLGGLERAGRHRLIDHDLGDRGVGPGDDQVAQRQDPHQPVIVIGDIDVVDGLGIGLELAQALDRVRGRQRRLDRDELGRHHAAG